MFSRETNFYIQLVVGVILLLTVFAILIFMWRRIKERQRKTTYKLPPLQTEKNIEYMKTSKDAKKITKIKDVDVKSIINNDDGDSIDEFIEITEKVYLEKPKKLKKHLPKKVLENYTESGEEIVKSFNPKRFNLILEELKENED